MTLRLIEFVKCCDCALKLIFESLKRLFKLRLCRICHCTRHFLFAFDDELGNFGYPNLKKHLEQFNKIITSDNRPYGLHRARNEKFFKGEKIISLRKCIEPSFTYTDFPCYVSQTFNVIKTDRVNLLYLTALLNSRLVRFWLKHRGKMQGQNFQVDKEPLLAIPLCVPEKSEQERLSVLSRCAVRGLGYKARSPERACSTGR